ncbi:hypothetical protein C5C95_11240 [Rathayibacter sp. AY1B7]|uniref:hypothetical protein n=1 Tax=Rathayibacter sp. AY1B7 TaxID=2080532 RepID=UPI000CE82820|nr:hypothetical protein [Rathayibacter sp. AY1B7]PPH97791.1 hypothetical protein C5C95_11240 [Rathayibacter sp. AY1B7]
MTAIDTIPAAVGVPAGIALWLAVIWPALPSRIRERLTPHRWIGAQARYCTAHQRCRGLLRFYNQYGVRICDATTTQAPAAFVGFDSASVWPRVIHCELHHGHRGRHYSIDADRTWTR